MKKYVVLLVFLAACDNRKATIEIPVEDDTYFTTAYEEPPPSSDPQHIDTLRHFIAKQYPHRDDSTVFIGAVESFDETREYYTPVFFCDPNIDDNVYYFLESKLDSVIYQDDEERRKRLPMAVARHFFRLGGLTTLSLYDRHSRYLSRAELVRIELYDAPIERSYIAVYRPESGAFLEDIAFGIGETDMLLPSRDLRYTAVENDSLTQVVASQLAITLENIVFALHVHVHSDNAVYSTIASGKEAFLTLLENGRVNVLNHVRDDFYILDIMPLHITRNGKPVLLPTIGVYDTDMIWKSPMVFEKGQYDFMEGSRLKIR